MDDIPSHCCSNLVQAPVDCATMRIGYCVAVSQGQGKGHRGRPSLSRSQTHYLAEVEDYNTTHNEHECTLVYGGAVDDHDPNYEPLLRPSAKHLPHGDRYESGVARQDHREHVRHELFPGWGSTYDRTHCSNWVPVRSPVLNIASLG